MSNPDKETHPKEEERAGISCMLNTEAGAVIAVVPQNNNDPNSQFISPSEDIYDSTPLRLWTLLSFEKCTEIVPNRYNFINALRLKRYYFLIEAQHMPRAATTHNKDAYALRLELFYFLIEAQHMPRAATTHNKDAYALRLELFYFLIEAQHMPRAATTHNKDAYALRLELFYFLIEAQHMLRAATTHNKDAYN
ncbi:hypothetical protein NE237_033154 [Protea cynaroides]|uniref:Uncharacterized protein n=1 Tax=Protea cynaroides TaxID=273540 RepID=A0A9Q0R4A1_9MAGN|nr:hypothetical protein NE237_033154 [Protea cynaroides]